MTVAALAETSDRDLWAAITQAPRPFRVVDFPRKKPDSDEPICEVAIWVLTQEDLMLAAASAERKARRLLKEKDGAVPHRDEAEKGQSDVQNNAASAEILFRACRQKDDPARGFFQVPEHVSKQLTTDEIGVLMHSYYRVQAELSPLTTGLTDDEIETYLARCNKAGSMAPLDSFSWGQLMSLVGFLARKVQRLLTSNLSLGSPREENSQNCQTATRARK